MVGSFASTTACRVRLGRHAEHALHRSRCGPMTEKREGYSCLFKAIAVLPICILPCSSSAQARRARVKHEGGQPLSNRFPLVASLLVFRELCSPHGPGSRHRRCVDRINSCAAYHSYLLGFVQNPASQEKHIKTSMRIPRFQLSNHGRRMPIA